MKVLVTVISTGLVAASLSAQVHPGPAKTPSTAPVQEPPIPLREVSRINVTSEMGGAFMSPSKCDADGNLYIRKYASDRPMLGPVAKVDAEGKRLALFDPVSFSQLELDRADAYSPAADGGMFQVAETGGEKPQLYVLHFSADGTAAFPIRLEDNFEAYAFAVFSGANLLVSGVQRDPVIPSDVGRALTMIFSSDGRKLGQLKFEDEGPTAKPVKSSRTLKLDLTDAEPGSDGNVYALRRSSPALVFVISPAGKILRSLKIEAPSPGAMPSAFHVSSNQVAVSFYNDENQTQTLVVADTQTGHRIRSYSDPGTLGPAFACYAADEGMFTFLHLGEGNTMEIVRADAR